MGLMDGERVIAFFGLRTIKTGVAVALSVYLSGFVPRSLPLLAGVAAILCLQPTIAAGVQKGFTRIKATLLGGLLGLVFHYLFGSHPLMMGVAVIIALRILNWLRWEEGVALASLTVIVIMSQAVGEVIPYVFGRVFSTLIGVVVAMVINILVAPPRHFIAFRSKLKDLTANFPDFYQKAIQAYGDNDLELAQEILVEMENKEKRVALLRRELKQLPSAPTSYLLYLEGIDFREYILFDRSIEFLRNVTARIKDLVEVTQRRYQRKLELLAQNKTPDPNGLSPQFRDLLQALHGLGAMLGELHDSVFRLVADEETGVVPHIREQVAKIGWQQEQVRKELQSWEVELIRELDIFSLMSAHRVIYDLEGITEALMGLARTAVRGTGQMLGAGAKDENNLREGED